MDQIEYDTALYLNKIKANEDRLLSAVYVLGFGLSTEPDPWYNFPKESSMSFRSLIIYQATGPCWAEKMFQ